MDPKFLDGYNYTPRAEENVRAAAPRVCYDANVVEFSDPVQLARFLAQLTREGVTFAVQTRSMAYWSVLLTGF
jgi:hypothetical protein